MDEESNMRKTLEDNFSTLMKDMNACSSQQEMRLVQKKHLLVHVNNLYRQTGKEEITHDLLESHIPHATTAPVSMTKDRHESFLNAEGDQIKLELNALLHGITKLKNADNADAMAAQMLEDGITAIGIESIVKLTENLMTGVDLADAVLNAIVDTTAAGSITVVIILVIAVIVPFFFYLQHSATGLLFLINELDKDIVFVEDYNVHGKEKVITSPIPAFIDVPNVGVLYNGGFIITTKRSWALIGSQYGVTYKIAGTDTMFQFGLCCPLSSYQGGHACYCDIGSSAKEVAEKVGHDKQLNDYAEKDGIKVEIKVSSRSGTNAFFIGRVFK